MAGTDIPVEVPREVFLAFNLRVEHLERVRKVVKVDTSTGSYALKRVIPAREKIQFAFRVVEYLNSKGFEAAVPFLLTKTGEPLYNQGEAGYVLSPWIEGKEADFKCREDLVLAADIMGRLHRAAVGFCLPEGEWVRNVLGQWPLRWKRGLEELRDLVEERVDAAAQDFFAVMRPILPELLRQGVQALELLNHRGNYLLQVEGARARRCLCHRDLVHHNLIIDRFGKVHIIDFEYCALELPVADVGRFLRKALPQTGWDWTKVKPLLRVYGEVYPLTAEDRWMLLALLTFPHDWWRLVRRYNEGVWPHNQLKQQLQCLVQSEQGRQIFLQEMAREIETVGRK